MRGQDKYPAARASPQDQYELVMEMWSVQRVGITTTHHWTINGMKSSGLNKLCHVLQGVYPDPSLQGVYPDPSLQGVYPVCLILTPHCRVFVRCGEQLGRRGTGVPLPSTHD